MWRFTMAPKGWWSNPKNQREYFAWLAEKLGIKGLMEWYQITNHIVALHDGSLAIDWPFRVCLCEVSGHGLLKKFRGSLPKALKSAFPNHSWQEWRFNNADKALWQEALNSPHELKRYFDDVSQQLNFKDLADWYRVNSKELTWAFGGEFQKRTSLHRALQLAYPGFPWDDSKFTTVTRETARHFESEVYRSLTAFFPPKGSQPLGNLCGILTYT